MAVQSPSRQTQTTKQNEFFQNFFDLRFFLSIKNICLQTLSTPSNPGIILHKSPFDVLPVNRFKHAKLLECQLLVKHSTKFRNSISFWMIYKKCNKKKDKAFELFQSKGLEYPKSNTARNNKNADSYTHIFLFIKYFNLKRCSDKVLSYKLPFNSIKAASRQTHV